jgi:hypothetical protein
VQLLVLYMQTDKLTILTTSLTVFTMEVYRAATVCYCA